MTAADLIASRSPDRTSVRCAGRGAPSQCEMVTGPGFSSPNQPDQERTTAYRDSAGQNSWSDAHCATIVGDWEEPSGEFRITGSRCKMPDKMSWRKLMSRKRFLGLTEKPRQDKKRDVRSPFIKDADRIIYSSPFRRLQDKTQLHPFPVTDYIRTRLTHSLEVSSVGRSLGMAVGQDVIKKHNLGSGRNKLESSDFGAVVAAACLAHDIGNPPFGHAGEEAIRHWFQQGKAQDLLRSVKDLRKKADLTAFEGNAQGFRILTRLAESREKGGLRLSSATLGAFMKYPCGSCSKNLETGDLSARKKFGYYQEDQKAFQVIANEVGLLRKGGSPGDRCRHPLAYLVEAADDICYLIVDMEDGHKYNMLKYEKVSKLLKEICGDEANSRRLKTMREAADKIAYLRAKAIGVLIGQVHDLFMKNEDAILMGDFEDELLNRIPNSAIIMEIRQLCNNRLYNDHHKIITELTGFEVVQGLLEIYVSAIMAWMENGWKTDGLAPKYQKTVQLLPGHAVIPKNPYQWLLRVTDYLSGMADGFALTQYQQLKGIRVEIAKGRI